MRLRQFVWFLAACVLMSGAANGLPITFTYTGHLTQISSLDPDSPFPDPISDDPSNPTSFSGSFTFDPLATNGTTPPDPKTGSYASLGLPYSFALSLGGLSFNFGGVYIGVLDNYGFPVGDQYEVSYFEAPTGANPTGVDLNFTLTDLSELAFAGNGLPLTPPSLADFTFTQFFFTDTIAGDQVEVAGVIDSLNAVPEPGTFALVTLGLWVLRRRTYRRQIRHLTDGPTQSSRFVDVQGM